MKELIASWETPTAKTCYSLTRGGFMVSWSTISFIKKGNFKPNLKSTNHLYPEFRLGADSTEEGPES